MKVAAIVFTAAFMAAPVGIEVLRGVVHGRRERRDGLGGTQDIAMWGTFAKIGCGVLAAGCWGLWLAREVIAPNQALHPTRPACMFLEVHRLPRGPGG